MAATIDEDLTESQIDKLLREAEERLSTRNTKNAVVAAPDAFHVAATPETQKETDSTTLRKATAKADSVAVRVVEAKKKKDKEPDNAGPKWYGLQKTVLTPEAKRDFQVLRMRGVIDPKQHFRRDMRKDMIPKFSVFGTIVEGTAEGETDRLTRKERRRTIAEEVLSSQEARKSFKRRYDKIQEKNKSGKKGFYKRLMTQRRRRP